MRTIILLIFTFILVVVFQKCSDSTISPSSDNSTNININRDTLNGNPLPCCNSGKPDDCDPTFKMGLYTECGEIEISCECCREVYEFYGNPANLRSITVPCTLVGTYVCIPSELE